MNSETPSNQPENLPTNEQNNKPNEFPWVGVILILLGIIFLAQQFGNFSFHNWWALFILIPAFSAFGSAYGLWRKAGRFTFGVWSTFYGGLFPLVVALIFLFDLEWGDYWPVFVILGGFGMFGSGLPGQRSDDDNVPEALLLHRSWAIFVGLGATLLGFTFLGQNLNLIEGLPFLDIQNWWGVFILLAALGGLVTGALLAVGGHSIVLVLVNFGLAAVVALTGMIAILNLEWRLMNMTAPLILILVGIGLLVGFGGEKDQQEE